MSARSSTLSAGLLIVALGLGIAARAAAAPAQESASPGNPPPPGPVTNPAERGRLRGEVYFTRQEPAVGASVILVKEGDPSRLAIGITDMHGYFRFESIPAGTYTVGVVKEGAQVVLKSGILVKPPVRSVVDIVLKKAVGHWDPPVIDLARFERQQGRIGSSAAGEGTERGNAALGTDDAHGTGASIEAGTGTGVDAGDGPGSQESHAASGPDGVPAKPGSDAANPGARALHMVVQVLDIELKPIREARVTLRSRGPAVNPMRSVTNEQGLAHLSPPEPGEYLFRVAVPGFLPARIDRLLLGSTPPKVFVVMNARPLDYPASPAELLPEDKPVPPEGFPGSRETKPSS